MEVSIHCFLLRFHLLLCTNSFCSILTRFCLHNRYILELPSSPYEILAYFTTTFLTDTIQLLNLPTRALLALCHNWFSSLRLLLFCSTTCGSLTHICLLKLISVILIVNAHRMEANHSYALIHYTSFTAFNYLNTKVFNALYASKILDTLIGMNWIHRMHLMREVRGLVGSLACVRIRMYKIHCVRFLELRIQNNNVQGKKEQSVFGWFQWLVRCIQRHSRSALRWTPLQLAWNSNDLLV